MSGAWNGYRDCACRDCFEIAIGEQGALCSECAAHGCEANAESECAAPGAYGAEEEEDDFGGAL